MNKINNILIATAIMLSATLTFTAENNNRYEEIAVAFCNETNSFDQNFVQSENDIAIITQHKNDLLKKIDCYKKSWMPMLLKIVGTQFAIDTGIRTIYLIATLAHLRVPKPLHYACTLGLLLGSPITLISHEITEFMRENLNILFFEKGSITSTQWRLGIKSILAIAALVTGKTAQYLFKKAHSYKNTITLLEQEIERDNAMISNLGSVEFLV